MFKVARGSQKTELWCGIRLILYGYLCNIEMSSSNDGAVEKICVTGKYKSFSYINQQKTKGIFS